MNNLLAMCWSFLAMVGWNVHFEWIPSELNKSDAVSRGDLEVAPQSRWAPLESDLKQLYNILEKVAGDLTYATGEAVDSLCRLTFRFGRP